MADTVYVAGRAVRLGGYNEEGNAVSDGTQVHEFQPGDVVPGASKLDGLEGLVLNLYLVPKDEYVEGMSEGEEGAAE